MTSLSELVPTLTEKTRQGRLEWTDGGDRSFITNVNNVYVRVSYDNRSQSIDHRLSVLDDSGNIIESLTPSRDTLDGDRLEELYDAARRKALRVDEALDTLKQALSRL